MSNYVIDAINDAIQDRLNPKGMATHSGEVSVNISHLQYVVKNIAELERQLAEAQKDVERYRRLAKAGWIDDAIMKHYGITDGDKDSLDAAIDATKPKSEPGEQD